MQSRAKENFTNKELEEKKSKEALLHVQKKYTLWKYQNERDVARRLQRFGYTRGTKKEADSQDFLSFDSCRSSAVDHVEESSLEPSRKSQDTQVVRSEIAGEEMRGSGDAWRLEPEGERRRWKPKVVSHGVEGVHVDPNGEGRHEREQVKKSIRQSEAPGEVGEEIKSPKRKIIWVESEETQDYVRGK